MLQSRCSQAQNSLTKIFMTNEHTKPSTANTSMIEMSLSQHTFAILLDNLITLAIHCLVFNSQAPCYLPSPKKSGVGAHHCLWWAIFSLGHRLHTFTAVPIGWLSLPHSVGRQNNCQLTGWVIITIAMVDVDGSCQFSADSQPKSTGLVWGLAATRRSVCTHQMNHMNSRNRQRKCADTNDTVLVPQAGHFHC